MNRFLRLALGVYENDNRLLFGGRVSTNWYIHFNAKQWVHVIGAGPGKSILASGSNTWYIQRDAQPSIAPAEAPVYFRNVKNVRFSGFTIIATNPPATLNDREWYPDVCTLIAVKGADNLHIDNLELDGRFDGQLYVIKSNHWSSDWHQWYFHAFHFDFGTSGGGIIGTNGVRVDHILSRGFQRFAYMNCYSGAGTAGNTNVVTIHNCTVLDTIDRGSGVEGVFHRHGITAHQYTAKYLVRNNIIAYHPRNGASDPLNTDKFFVSCDADAMDSFGIPQVMVYANQLYSIGLDAPFERWYSSPGGITEPGENYYGEQPVFFEYNGVPFSTEGTNYAGRLRDVGWNPIIPHVPLPRAGDTNIFVSIWRTNGTLTIYNDGPLPCAYTASDDAAWLVIDPAYVSTVVSSRMDIPFTINRTGLPEGAHRATVTLHCGAYGTYAYSVRHRVRAITPGRPYVYGLHMTTLNTNGAYTARITHFSVAGINDTTVNPLGLTGPACPAYICDYTHSSEYNSQWAIRPGGANAVAYLEITVEPAQMVVQGNNKPIVSGPATPTLENGTDFGPVAQDGAAVTNQFVIYNASGSNLVLTAAAPVLISGGDAARFAVLAQPPSLIAPLSSADFDIVFTALSKDAEYASTVVISNSAAVNPFVFNIHGGIPEPFGLAAWVVACAVVRRITRRR